MSILNMKNRELDFEELVNLLTQGIILSDDINFNMESNKYTIYFQFPKMNHVILRNIERWYMSTKTTEKGVKKYLFYAIENALNKIIDNFKVIEINQIGKYDYGFNKFLFSGISVVLKEKCLKLNDEDVKEITQEGECIV